MGEPSQSQDGVGCSSVVCGCWGEDGDGGAWGDQSRGGYTCSPCHNVECDVLHQCVAGVVPDRCGCCQVCARSEGELCDGVADQKLGTCGDNLDCQYQQESGESICVCS